MTSKILVTGGNGQLATCLKDIEPESQDHEFIYTDYEELDITDFHHLRTYFKEHSVQWCVNCAAYTAVDKAENDKDKATKINVRGAENLANVCNEFRVKLIHISTDFVFDGTSSTPYTEIDAPNPLSVYGHTKLDGELSVKQHCAEHFILRTSWLYSEHGHNFMKTMLSLAETREKINVVVDQIGTPTYAGDLAELIVKIISTDSENYGLYHYSNEGVASWYDFAKVIFDMSQIDLKVYPISTTDYPTPAARPKFSIMDKRLTKNTFKSDIPYWQESLKKAIKRFA